MIEKRDGGKITYCHAIQDNALPTIFDLFRNFSHLLPSHRWRVEVVAPGNPNQREDWMDLDHLIFAQSLPETEYLVIGIWISKFDMEFGNGTSNICMSVILFMTCLKN